MAILKSSQITFVDTTDQQKLSAYITSNLTTVQIRDSSTGAYNPDWTTTNLLLVPSVFLDQTEVSLDDPNIQIVWERREGNKNKTELISGENVVGGQLVVSKNMMQNSAANMLTYICSITYTSPVSKTATTISSQLTHTMIPTASNAITFRLYSPDGTLFSSDTTELKLETSKYDGTTSITQDNANFQWYKYMSGEWIALSGTEESYTVKSEDVTNVASYRCVMEYPKNSGQEYMDVITLEDKADIYTSEILTVGGTTFRNGQGGSGVYVIVRENGKEVDGFSGGHFPGVTLPPSANEGDYFYRVEHANKCIEHYIYKENSWILIDDGSSIPQVLTYEWSLMDKDGNDVEFDKAGKVIYLSCDEINSIGTIQCDVKK